MGGIGGVNVVGNSLEALSNRLTMRRFICIECTEHVEQCNTSQIRLQYSSGAQGGSFALLVSQYAVWAEQWASATLGTNQPAFLLNLYLYQNFQTTPSFFVYLKSKGHLGFQFLVACLNP